MSKFLITGDPGSGKSTVARELAQRGYAAFDTDDLPDVTRLEDMAGQAAGWPEPPLDWSRHAWNWQATGLRRILDSAETAFVAAIATNQQKFYSWFNAIFVLTADRATLSQRLGRRQGHHYGGHPAELAEILDGHPKRVAEMLSEPHSVAIDATRPSALVARDIIARAMSTAGRKVS